MRIFMTSSAVQNFSSSARQDGPEPAWIWNLARCQFSPPYEKKIKTVADVESRISTYIVPLNAAVHSVFGKCMCGGFFCH